MPSRVMRAEILSSESLSMVSLEADLLFRSLILVADDYGRLDGRIKLLRVALFPLRPQAAVKKVERWLDELLLLDDPPVVSYVVGGRPYLALTGWERHRGKSKRAQSSKFPAPPDVNKNKHRASPEIRGKSGDPPVGMESRVRGMESREIAAEAAEIQASRSLPSEWDMANPKPRLRPKKFEGEARREILDWAERRGFHGRILHEAQQAWDRWGPTQNFRRPISSWVGSFKTVTDGAIRAGEIKLESDDECAAREIREFRERSGCSPLRAVGESDG